MNSVTLGKTGLQVSELGFGGIPIIPREFEEAVKVVRHCFESGMTFFDTANAYADSEKKIGKALESVRDKVIFATKSGKRDAEGVREHIGYSLDNLRTDHIDIYQFHADTASPVSRRCSSRASWVSGPNRKDFPRSSP